MGIESTVATKNKQWIEAFYPKTPDAIDMQAFKSRFSRVLGVNVLHRIDATPIRLKEEATDQHYYAVNVHDNWSVLEVTYHDHRNPYDSGTTKFYTTIIKH